MSVIFKPLPNELILAPKLSLSFSMACLQNGVARQLSRAAARVMRFTEKGQQQHLALETKRTYKLQDNYLF